MKILVLCLIIIIPVTVFSQRTEFRIKASTGLWYYTGNSAGRVQPVYYPSFVQKVYGRKSGLPGTIGGELRHVSRKKWLTGFGLDYQLTSAYSKIDSVSFITTDPASGKAITRSQFICFSPFTGKRFLFGKNHLDITGGFGFAFILSHKYELYYTPEGGTRSEFKYDRDAKQLDLRLQLSAEWQMKKLSVFAGYARGTMNYFKPHTGSSPRAHSNFLNVGVGYQLH